MATMRHAPWGQRSGMVQHTLPWLALLTSSQERSRRRGHGSAQQGTHAPGPCKRNARPRHHTHHIVGGSRCQWGSHSCSMNRLSVGRRRRWLGEDRSYSAAEARRSSHNHPCTRRTPAHHGRRSHPATTQGSRGGQDRCTPGTSPPQLHPSRHSSHIAAAAEHVVHHD